MRNEKRKCPGKREIRQPLKCHRSVPGPESMPLGGIVSGLCTEQGTGARAPWSRRCILESSPQQGRALPPCGHSPTTREAETAASPRACCVSWVVYGIGHAITLRRGTPNEVAEATCSTGRLCGHRGLGQGLRRHRPQGQAWGLKSELGQDESHQAALTSVLPSFLTL